MTGTTIRRALSALPDSACPLGSNRASKQCPTAFAPDRLIFDQEVRLVENAVAAIHCVVIATTSDQLPNV
jgi:hypothetical protein